MAHAIGSDHVELLDSFREANLGRREFKDMSFDLVAGIGITVNGFLEEEGVGWGGNNSNVDTMHGK